MKEVLDKFGMGISVKNAVPNRLRKSKCLYFSYFLQLGGLVGRIRVEGTEEVVTDYKEMARKTPGDKSK